MKLCVWEMKKLVKQSRAIMLLLLLFLASCVFFWQRMEGAGDDAFGSVEYCKMAQDYKSGKLTWEEIRENAESAEGMDDIRYSGNEATERMLYQTLYDECRQIREYSEFRSGITDGASAFMGIGGPFYQRNIEKMAADYHRLKDIVPKFAGLHGVSLLSEIGKSEYCILFFLVLLASLLFSHERQNQMGVLLYPVPKGRISLGCAKYVVGALCVAISVALYSLIQILLVYATYGIGDADSVIQAVPGFGACSYLMTIRQFLPAYVLMRIMVGLMLYSVFFIIQCTVRKEWLAVLLCICLLVTFTLFRIVIHPNASAAILYYYNPVTMFDVVDAVVGYRNENVLGYPISRLAICVACQAGVFLCCTATAIFFFSTNLLRQGAGRRKGRKLCGKRFRFRLLGGEIFKCLAVQRGGLVCAAVLLLTLSFSPNVSDDLGTANRVYYKSYIRHMEGSYSEEKMKTLAAERERLNKEEEILSRDTVTTEAAEIITHDLERRPALDRTIRYGNYLSGKKHSSFVYPEGYLICFGVKRKRAALWYDMMGVFMSIFLAWLIAAIDVESGMEQLIAASAHGSKKMGSVKRKAVAVVTFAAMLALQFIFFFTVGREYGYSGMTATAQSIRQFSQVPSWIRLWHMAAACIFIRYGILLACGQAALALYGRFFSKRRILNLPLLERQGDFYRKKEES